MDIFLSIKISIIIVLTSLNSFSQTEEFNPGMLWVCTSGAGIQNYGPPENYLSTNLGNTPYPNSSVITMTSPVTSYLSCVTPMTVSFPLQGIIENGWDFMYFQYSTNGGTSWTTLGTYTGVQNTTYTYVVPNTANRFRFRLVTDGSINTYGFPTVYVYYYDIARFTVNCLIALPISITDFYAQSSCTSNIISWSDESSENVTYFLERSLDGETWTQFNLIVGKGSGTYFINDYNFVRDKINYYRISQLDQDGNKFFYDHIISSDNTLCDKGEIVKVVNTLGQEVKFDQTGLVLIYYSSGVIEKVMR